MTTLLTLEALQAFLRLDNENLDLQQEGQLALTLQAAESYVAGAVDGLYEKSKADEGFKSKAIVACQIVAQEIWDNRKFSGEKDYKPSYMLKAFLLQLQTTPMPPEVTP